MADVYHQHCTRLCFKISFPDMQVIFMHLETIYPVIDLCITDTFGKIDLLKGIAKLERFVFRIYLITLTRFKSLMIALLGFFELSENFLEAFFTDPLLCFRSNFYLSILIFLGNIS